MENMAQTIRTLSMKSSRATVKSLQKGVREGKALWWLPKTLSLEGREEAEMPLYGLTSREERRESMPPREVMASRSSTYFL